MKYMMLICRDPSIELSPQDRASMPGWVSAWVEEMDSRGIRLQGDLFQPASDGRTVRIRDGQMQLANGPFADTREQIGGYNIIDCADLDQAIDVAAQHPIARFGAVEIRPFSPQ
jgi:hypothetical protein